MSEKTAQFLSLCISQLGITNRGRLEDIRIAYEKWLLAPLFPVYEAEGVRNAWIGPVQPGVSTHANSWEPISASPLFGFVEDVEGRKLGFRFTEKRPFEDVDFGMVLDYLRRDNQHKPDEMAEYFRKMYRLPIEQQSFFLAPDRPPLDLWKTGVWYLRWIITGIDVESAQKKGIYEHLVDEILSQWQGVQERTQSSWNGRLIALLRREPASTVDDYDHFREFILKTSSGTVQAFVRHPWAIGLVNRKSATVSERDRYQFAKALMDGAGFEDACTRFLGLGPEELEQLAGHGIEQLAEGDPHRLLATGAAD